MLLEEDVQNDLMVRYPGLYKREGELFVYQNGRDNPKYLVEVTVHFLGGGE